VRRRTPGLRREEVAQRANVSATWYTWLEQGRGGAPSVDALERIARALTLNDTEREHLFLLAQGRPPEVRDTASSEIVTPRLQRLLDSLTRSPAFVKNATWDILAWNRAATGGRGEDRRAPRLSSREAPTAGVGSWMRKRARPIHSLATSKRRSNAR
jgi:transcriptional regulator with XRE-family HTH domain